MCPEPALLVAYLDGTLFHRDARAVDEHVLTCAACTALLADMRRQRAAESQRSRRSSARTIGIAAAAVAVVAIGLWAVMPPPLPPAVEPRLAEPRPAEPRPVEPPPTAQPVRPVVPEKAVPKPAPNPTTPGRLKPAPTSATAKTASRATEEPVPVAGDESGLVLRGRNANRRFVWRVRELVIERSTDGGATWMTEHTSDRPVRAGAFVDANVAWLVGENGLVLRRTVNGWFGASPPAAGHLIAVRASSPSRATVTHDDGRMFTTDNGGVTWSAP